MRSRLVLLAVLALGVVGAASCGAGDDARRRAETQAQRVRAGVGDARERARDLGRRVRRARAQAERVGTRLADRVRKALDGLRKAVPTAGPATRAPQAAGRTDSGTIDDFLTDVLRSVDAYWTRTLRASGRPAPRVGYDWVAPGDVVRTGCGATADDHAGFYCPADDVIYVGQALAAEVYQGVARGLPGQQAGAGRAQGDFGVAYIVAHEYAHQIQQELGFLSSRAGGLAKPFELQADCMAGLWGNSVYRAGALQPGDVQEAVGTVLAVGDFDLGAEQHHGTPTERRDAWLLGFDSGDPSACRHFVAA
jgi:predicted metalloprotease